MIQLPPAMCAATDEPATLLDTIFGRGAQVQGQQLHGTEAKNADVDALNEQALQTSPGQVRFPMAYSHLATIYSAPILSHSLHAQVDGFICNTPWKSSRGEQSLWIILTPFCPLCCVHTA